MSKIYNNEFINILQLYAELIDNPMKEKAYTKAAQTIITHDKPIYNHNDLNPRKIIFDLYLLHKDVVKDLKGIGTSIYAKLKEYVETNEIKNLNVLKNNPMHLFTKIYGVGKKKAQQLVDMNITTIEELRNNKDKLNNTQIIGLNYYEDINLRIPRQEIELYDELFKNTMNKFNYIKKKYEIVGSYRRGAESSGDIDVIITNDNDDKQLLKDFVNELVDSNVILHKLTNGDIKILVIAKLAPQYPARRIDFLFTTKNEYSFALLYFTGSKLFNLFMRQHALDMGYTLNEHAICTFKDKVKEPVNKTFKKEQDIFKFLKLEYKEPHERIDKSSIIKIKAIKMTIKTKKNTLNNSKTKNSIKKQGGTTNKNISLKTFINTFREKGVNILDNYNVSQLISIITQADKAFHNDSSVITDNEYDIIKEHIKKHNPEHEIFLKIGAPTKNKVSLPYEMWSMDKIKPDSKALNNWIQKYNDPLEYVLSAKLDGVSGLYANNKLYTRGNGTEGQDISRLIPYLNLPTLEDNVVLRGEFIISKTNFNTHFKDYANPRNTVSGIINKLKTNENIKYVDFICYECIHPALPPIQQLELIKSLKIKVVPHLFIQDKIITKTILSNYLTQLRETLEYDIDGIICNHNKIYQRESANPKHAFAFKMIATDTIVETHVLDVLWEPSKDGYLKPRVYIDKVNLGGVNVEYATAFNADYVVKNKLGPGAVIKIHRSGDVIPHILEVVQHANKTKLPTDEYEWTDNHIDIVLKNKNNNLVKEKVINKFFREINVDGMNIGTIKSLIENGYDDIYKILNMQQQDFLTIPLFKDKKATKIYNNIKTAVQKTTLIDIMAASNIFGRGLGYKKLEVIINTYPNILTQNLSDKDNIERLITIDGIQMKTAQYFISHIEEFKAFLKQCNLEHKSDDNCNDSCNDSCDDKDKFKGHKYVFSGFRDKTLEDNIKKLGGTITTNVSKNTTYLIVKNINDTSDKIEKARGINKLITLEDFKLINNI